jgi:hypothetical protein
MRKTMVRLTSVTLLITPSASWACPFCNVDGPATRGFILTVFGAIIVAATMLLLWSIACGHYQNVEAPKHRLLELERENQVALHLTSDRG